MTSPEAELAALLVEARRTRRPIERLADRLVPPDEDAAYRVAALVAQTIEERGSVWKIGATALDNLRDLGASQPIYGRVAAGAVRPSLCRLRFADLMTPVDECEFAFVLADDLPVRAEPWSADNLSERIAALHPAIEVGERRIARTHPVPIAALIADASAAGHLVLGAAVPDWRRHDLAAATVALRIDGVEHRRGSGREVLGHPLTALVWLANRRAAEGTPLRGGDIVTTGSCTGMTLIAPGTTHTADFGPLGQVEVAFD
jgi:2-keto-4-pentenoate hydratase